MRHTDQCPRSSPIPAATTSQQSGEIPKNFEFFRQAGWALRVHKPPTRVSQLMKDFIGEIYREEKVNGRKISPDEYVRRIRSARDTCGDKLFLPCQYLTVAQVNNGLSIWNWSTRRHSSLLLGPQSNSANCKRKNIERSFQPSIQQQKHPWFTNVWWRIFITISNNCIVTES